MRSCTLANFFGWFGFLVLFGVTPVSAQSNQTIYADSLQNGWVDYSWATVNFANTSPVHSGSDSISVTAGAWAAVYFHNNTAFDPSGYTNLSFWPRRNAQGRISRSATCRRAMPMSPSISGCARSNGSMRSFSSARMARWNGCRARRWRSQRDCAPEALLGPTPVIYPFIVNNPGEAAQAKRRERARSRSAI